MRNLKYRGITVAFSTLLMVAIALLCIGTMGYDTTIIETGTNYHIDRIDYTPFSFTSILGLWVLWFAIVFAVDALIIYLE